MAEEEKKRNSSMEVSTSQPPAKKKRVAVGEFSNPYNARNPQAGAVESELKKIIPEKKGEELEVEKSKEIEVSHICVSIAGAIADEGEVEHPQMATPNVSNMYQYLRSKEVEPMRRPLLNYMEIVQTEVTADMRGILIDWLVDVAEEYDLQSDTLFLTVSYIDRFLSHNAISRQRLQLLGVSSMLIASKYEEITPPHVEYFCKITSNGYSKEEVLEMESDLFKFLKFEMGHPTVLTFLRRFIDAAKEDSKRSNKVMKSWALYLAELSLIDYRCIKFLPSVIAASAIYLARFTIDPTTHPWNKKLEACTGYKAKELKECICALHELQSGKRCSSLRAVRNKYKNKQQMEPSVLR